MSTRHDSSEEEGEREEWMNEVEQSMEREYARWIYLSENLMNPLASEWTPKVLSPTNKPCRRHNEGKCEEK